MIKDVDDFLRRSILHATLIVFLSWVAGANRVVKLLLSSFMISRNWISSGATLLPPNYTSQLVLSLIQSGESRLITLSPHVALESMQLDYDEPQE